MERIETQLGTLLLDGLYCQDKLKAELRGLELLCSIVNATPVWSFNLSSEKPFLCSNDDGPTILIDIFQCIQSQLIDDDPHLSIYMSQIRVCVLKDEKGIETPATDSIVSLALLGIAGWPINATPATLCEKALQSGTYTMEDCSQLLPHDFEEIQNAEQLNSAGITHASISVLTQMARRWYVCRSWTVEKVRETLAPLLSTYTANEIERYLADPDEACDSLFITA